MLFHLFLVGLCCMNNEAQCPSGVPPTPCSDSMLMTPECNTSQSQPSVRYCGKTLWQSRINIPSNLFRHLSNYRVECILKEQLADFYEPVWCQWVNWGYTACELQSLSLSPGWRSPNTHTLETWGPIMATQVILEWQSGKEREEYLYLHLHTESPPSSPVSGAGNASCPIISKWLSVLCWVKFNYSKFKYFTW